MTFAIMFVIMNGHTFKVFKTILNDAKIMGNEEIHSA